MHMLFRLEKIKDILSVVKYETQLKILLKKIQKLKQFTMTKIYKLK